MSNKKKKCNECGKIYYPIRMCCNSPSCYLAALYETQLVKKYPGLCPDCRHKREKTKNRWLKRND